LDEVRAILSAHGFDPAGMRYTAMLHKIQAASA
jgi:hypothetical protein